MSSTALHGWRLSIFGTRLYMLYMPNRHQTRAASVFIDFMLERARDAGRREADGPPVPPDQPAAAP